MTINLKQIRATNMQALRDLGFTPVELPLGDPTQTLRPIEEIAKRLAAINAYYIFMAAPPDRYSNERIQTHLDAHDLASHLTDEEHAAMDMDNRAESAKQHAHFVGWKAENALALAWILGGSFVPSCNGQMITPDAVRDIVVKPPLATPDKYDAWFQSLKPRTVEEVFEMEDRFYCCHNAVRSAQVLWMAASKARKPEPRTYPTVPVGFHPARNGGVIHERRHALTWALSPGTDWEETDLST